MITPTYEKAKNDGFRNNSGKETELTTACPEQSRTGMLYLSTLTKPVRHRKLDYTPRDHQDAHIYLSQNVQKVIRSGRLELSWRISGAYGLVSGKRGQC